MLELAVLGLLSEQPLHGYELKKRLSRDARLALGDLLRLAVPGAAPARAFDGAIEVGEPTDAARRFRRHRLAQRRPRRRPRAPPAPRRAGAPARRTASPPPASSCSSSCLTDDDRRRRAHLRAEALVLPAPRAPTDRLEFLERRRAAAHPAPGQDAAQPGAQHRSLHPVAPRAPHPVHPTRSRVDRGADRARARRHAPRPHRRSNRMSPSPRSTPHQRRRRRSVSRSPESGTARAASSRASSSTATPIRPSACPV